MSYGYDPVENVRRQSAERAEGVPVVKIPNPGTKYPTRPEVESCIRAVCADHGTDPDVMIRQCEAESNFNQAARSPCGAVGLFQLLPSTAREMGVNPALWQQNVSGAAKYLRWLLAHYSGHYPEALAAYNWGVGHLDKLIHQYPDDWRLRLPHEASAYLGKIL